MGDEEARKKEVAVGDEHPTWGNESVAWLWGNVAAVDPHKALGSMRPMARHPNRARDGGPRGIGEADLRGRRSLEDNCRRRGLLRDHHSLATRHHQPALGQGDERITLGGRGRQVNRQRTKYRKRRGDDSHGSQGPHAYVGVTSRLSSDQPNVAYSGRICSKIRIAFSPMMPRISSLVKPSSSKACAISARPVVSKGTGTAPSKSEPSDT